MKPIIAIAGRPNVGKSQLFNKMLGKTISIVQDEPGITRDRIYSECEWTGRRCLLVDTGGIDEDITDPIKAMAQVQVRKALEEASLILFVVDIRAGITTQDEQIAVELKKLKKPILIVGNKADNLAIENESYEFASLGFGIPFCISALHGTGVADLMDKMFAILKIDKSDKEDNDFPRISLAGRRNVGKSSILNVLCGEDRSIVHNTGGTTRDNVESAVKLGGRNFTVTDTSGLRRKGKISEKVEFYSTIRTLQAIEESECVILVLNADEGITNQDLKVAEQIQKARKSSIIIVNKWDLIEEKCKGKKQLILEQRKKWLEDIKGIIYFLSSSPILFTSAKTGKGFDKLRSTVEQVLSEYNKRIDTPIVNKMFREAQEMRPAPSYKGKQLRIYFACQTSSAPPVFTVKVNSTKLIHFSYERYLENYVRKSFGFIGSPIILNFKNNKGDDEEKPGGMLKK